jgi:hypothetical protein
VLVSVGIGTKVGVGVNVGETAGDAVGVGVASRVGVRVGVVVGINRIAAGVSVAVDIKSGVGVLVGGVVHQGAVKEKPSNTQVRLPPPLQIVWNTSSWRPGWKSVSCPRSSGEGMNLFPDPIGMETA